MNAFIDISEEEQLLELVKYAASVLEDPKFEADCTAQLEGGKSELVFQALIKQSPQLFTGPDEVELVFNSMARLVRVQSPTVAPGLVRDLAAALSSRDVKGYELSRLKVLGNLFNNLAADSASRYDTYKHVVALACHSGNVDAITPQFAGLDGWFAAWGTKPDQRRSLYKHIFTSLEGAARPKLSIDFVKKYLLTFNGAAAGDVAGAKADAELLLTKVLAHPDLYNERSVLSLDAVKQLEGTPLHALCTVLMDGDVAKLQAWLGANKGLLTKHGLSEAGVSTKVKLMALAALCAEYQATPVEYAAVASGLDIAEDDVESWIIDGIRAGLIEARIDEVNRKLHIIRSSAGTFESKHWQELKDKLEGWKANIADVQKNLDSVRSQVANQILQSGGIAPTR